MEYKTGQLKEIMEDLQVLSGDYNEVCAYLKNKHNITDGRYIRRWYHYFCKVRGIKNA